MPRTDKRLEREISAAPSWGQRLVGLEGLRGLAALSVLVVHTAGEMASGTGVSGGYFWTVVSQFRHGLTLFFVLSGFLLFRPFVTAVIAGHPRPPLGRFWANRALRVFPAYIVILLLTSYLLQVAHLPSRNAAGQTTGILQPLDLAWDLTLLQTYSPDHFGTGITVAWSLTVELTFYLLLPLFGMLAAALAHATRKHVAGVLVPVALMFVIGLAGRSWVALSTRGMTAAEYHDVTWGDNWATVFSRSILCQGDLFAFGMLVAVIYVCLERGLLRRERVPFWLAGAGIGLVAFMIITVKRPFPDMFVDTTAGAAAACLLLLTVFPTPKGNVTVVAKIMEWPVVVYLGIVSYSVYLWHMPVIVWLTQRDLVFEASIPGFLLNIAVVTVLTVALASATYFGVEKQALKLKRRTDTSRATGALPQQGAVPEGRPSA